jgi:hypothetical protein
MQELCRAPTNIESDCAVLTLIDNMVLEDLVVQSPRRCYSRRHDACGKGYVWYKAANSGRSDWARESREEKREIR